MKELPEGWERKKLGDVLDVVYRYPTYYGIQYEESGVPEVRGESLFDDGEINSNPSELRYISPKTSAKFPLTVLKEGDLVLTVRGTIGKVGLVRAELAGANITANLIRLSPKFDVILGEYLKHLLLSPSVRNELDKLSPSTTIKTITAPNLKSLDVPIPPLDTQRKIVAILDKAEETKRLRARANELTQTMLQSVFLEMFGDPVTNPKGWDTTPIGSVTSLISSGSTPLGGSSVYTDHGILFIRSQNVLMNHLSKEDMVNITHETHKNMRRTWVKKGDILFNITGASIGRVAWFNGEDDSANVNQHVCIIRPIKERIVTEFLSYHLSMQSYQNKIMANQSGATRQAFNFSQIREFEMIAPEYSLQKQFAEAVWEVQKTQSCQKAARCKNDDLFNAIVTKAFTGELFA